MEVRRGLAYAGVQKGTAAAASHVSAAPPAGAAQHCTVAVEAACQPAGISCLGLASCREEALPHKVLAREASGLSAHLLMLLSMHNGSPRMYFSKSSRAALGAPAQLPSTAATSSERALDTCAPAEAAHTAWT